MKSFLPRIEISLSKIRHNARILSERYGRQGIELMGVSKAILGDPAIAQAMVQGGVKFIADSRLENIEKLRASQLETQFVLLRTALSQAEAVVAHVDISLNTELETLKELSHYAQSTNKIHQVIIMVELGDLREGVLPGDLLQFLQRTLRLSHLKVVGIGCNLACYGGIKPDLAKMQELSQLATALEHKLHIQLQIVSGGNSANDEWAQSTPEVGRVNNLRLGESILLGRETVYGKTIAGLKTDAFELFAEVIESKLKPSLPFGQSCPNAFGEMPVFRDQGMQQRAILALGRQDVSISDLRSDAVELLGSSSDHIILHSNQEPLVLGSTVKFQLNYGGVLAAMTSPFIRKQFIDPL